MSFAYLSKLLAAIQASAMSAKIPDCQQCQQADKSTALPLLLVCANQQTLAVL